jgi:hypothetical protein
MIRVATKPMSKVAVEEANNAVPVADTPAGKKAWMDAYIKAGGSHKTIVNKAPPANSAQQAIKLSQTNQAANKQSPGSPGKIVAECRTTLCTADILVISEKGRNYKLELTRTKSQAVPDNPDNIIQVISGWDQETAVDINFLTKSCYRATPLPCSAVRVEGGTVDMTIPPGSGSVKVFCKTPPTSIDQNTLPLPFFFSHCLFPSRAEAENYTVKTIGCGGHQSLCAQIEAFPKVSWDGELKLNLNFVNASPRSGNHETTFGLTTNVNMTYGKQRYKLGVESPRGKLNNHGIEGLLAWAFSLVDRAEVLKKLSDYVTRKGGLVEVSLIWPSIEISGGAKNDEIKDKYMVSSKTDVKIKATILGVGVKGDILDFLAACYCKPLLEIKKLAAKGASAGKYASAKAVIAIVADIKTKIGGDLTYESDGQTPKVTGSIIASGTFGLKGEVYAEGRLWLVVAGDVVAGAGVLGEFQSAKDMGTGCGLEGTLTPVIYTKGEGFDWGGKIKFNGLAFYYALYVYYGMEDAKTLDRDEENNSGRGGTAKKKPEPNNGKSKSEKKEVKDKIILWDPCTYP